MPLPGDEDDKYYPRGFNIEDLGPKYSAGKEPQPEIRAAGTVHSVQPLGYYSPICSFSDLPNQLYEAF
ncbi:hypothetical protein P175DRAFT_0497751 [Aspergillus ochraceoroseus IBT 24754]|uniref:Uncharacterized protein n=1 Tax=Aspergillus ochraceoroseus IBT 24754 TaxID=1392256 RepID=A0A2T5M806_9EURO|nr:uncharacterized protein P175DRAFT_0497751 [Aspergillus ochraceoroseus IBT 24754]PTU24646.1 hypothetical protein P175DRAFT_0497751 [Aspergillus ochraceoroseus IBT 24754]